MTDKKPVAILDLADLDTAAASDKGAEIELLHPSTNSPTGVFITILGKDSEAFRDYVRTETNAAIKREAMAKRRGREAPLPTAEEGEAKAVELLVICTLGWRTGDTPAIQYKGEMLPFNVANAIMLYTNLIWIRRQIDEAVGDLERFM